MCTVGSTEATSHGEVTSGGQAIYTLARLHVTSVQLYILPGSGTWRLEADFPAGIVRGESVGQRVVGKGHEGMGSERSDPRRATQRHH